MSFYERLGELGAVAINDASVWLNISDTLKREPGGEFLAKLAYDVKLKLDKFRAEAERLENK